MPGCVLRLTGTYKKLVVCLEAIPLDFEEAHQSRLARERGETTFEDQCTFNLVVCDDNGDHIPLQIQAAEGFIVENNKLLVSLMTQGFVESASLDFCWKIPRHRLASYNVFPPSLLRLCGELGISLEISLYLSSGELSDVDQVEAAQTYRVWKLRHAACRRCHGEAKEVCICGPEPCRKCGGTEFELLEGSICTDCMEETLNP